MNNGVLIGLGLLGAAALAGRQLKIRVVAVPLISRKRGYQVRVLGDLNMQFEGSLKGALGYAVEEVNAHAAYKNISKVTAYTNVPDQLMEVVMEESAVALWTIYGEVQQ